MDKQRITVSSRWGCTVSTVAEQETCASPWCCSSSNKESLSVTVSVQNHQERQKISRCEKIKADKMETQRKEVRVSGRKRRRRRRRKRNVGRFQEELQRRLGSPAGSRSWLPRRVFIRLQGRNQKEERRGEIRAHGWRRRRRSEWVTPGRPRGHREVAAVILVEEKERHTQKKVHRVVISDSWSVMQPVSRRWHYADTDHSCSPLECAVMLFSVCTAERKNRSETLAVDRTFLFQSLSWKYFQS